jgi:hypothetical protein
MSRIPTGAAPGTAYKLFMSIDDHTINIAEIATVRYKMVVGTVAVPDGEAHPVQHPVRVAEAAWIGMRSGDHHLFKGIDAERVRLFLAPFALIVPDGSPEWADTYHAIVAGGTRADGRTESDARGAGQAG